MSRLTDSGVIGNICRPVLLAQVNIEIANGADALDFAQRGRVPGMLVTDSNLLDGHDERGVY
jgi:hypothetical protein